MLDIEPDSLVRQAIGVISKPFALEHMHKRTNGTSCEIQVSVPTNNHAQSRLCLCTVNSEFASRRFIQYTWHINLCEHSFETNPFCHASTKCTCQ